jgi:hypothetical protein
LVFVRLLSQGQHAQGQVRQTDQEPWQGWSVQNEMGWRRDGLLPCITAGNALCLALNRPEQGGILTVKEQVGHRLVTTLPRWHLVTKLLGLGLLGLFPLEVSLLHVLDDSLAAFAHVEAGLLLKVFELL